MSTIRLENGAVLRYRLVPPYARAQAYFSLKDPPPPKEELKSAAGHTEEVLADEESAAYQEWFDELQEVRRVRAQRQQDMTLDYGIEAWLLPPPDGLLGLIVRLLRAIGIRNWRSAPPEDWEIPESLERYGVTAYVSRRLTYIQIELITTNKDLERVVRIVGDLGEAGELTDEEVEAAEASFRAEMGSGAAAGSTDASDNGNRADAGGDLSSEGVGPQASSDVV